MKNKKLSRREASLVSHARRQAVEAFRRRHVVEVIFCGKVVTRVTIRQAEAVALLSGTPSSPMKTTVQLG